MAKLTESENLKRPAIRMDDPDLNSPKRRYPIDSARQINRILESCISPKIKNSTI